MKHGRNIKYIMRNNEDCLSGTYIQKLQLSAPEVDKGGKDRRKKDVGRKQYLWLKNKRDWTHLDTGALLRDVQNRNEFARIAASID